jgi:hypothetical protein
MTGRTAALGGGGTMKNPQRTILPEQIFGDHHDGVEKYFELKCNQARNLTGV